MSIIACWKIVEKYSRFVSIFTSLGLSWELEEELAEMLLNNTFVYYTAEERRE